MPLVIGFCLLGLVMCAGAVVAGQVFVQQRELQARCDGAAAAAGAQAADIDRGAPLDSDGDLRFIDAEPAVDAYLARAGPPHVAVAVSLADGNRTLRLRCESREPVVLGAVFGKAHGVHHVVESSVREPLS